MIGLQQYITESMARKDYGVLLDHIEFDKIPTLAKLIAILKDGLEQANQRYQILRINAVEELNKKKVEWREQELKKALPRVEQQIVDYMKTKPGIMKRSEEKRQKYINDKLEKFKAEYPQARLAAIELKDKSIRYAWHHDITSEQGYSDLSYNATIDKVATRIAEEIDSKRNKEYWDHLTGIDIAAASSELTTDWRPQYHIVPMFDEETEKKLSKSVRRFQDFMSGEYESGRYMGD